MTAPNVYLLDANVFIEAKRRYYAFDLCPGFWDSLLWHQGQGAVGSIDRVKGELQRGGDDLAEWVEKRVSPACFASTDSPEVVDWFTKIAAWVQDQAQFLPEAKAEFAQSADGWLIAYAKVRGLVLVTHEALAREARRNVPMPNLCEAFGVPYLDTFEMLRSLQARFTWQPPA